MAKLRKDGKPKESGRPPTFKTPEEMQAKIDRYLQTTELPTITGLAYALGFESRQSFYDYEKREEFSYTVRRARLFIEESYERGLRTTAPTGSIFALKNFGWTDKQEHEHTGKDGGPMEVKVTVVNQKQEGGG